MNEPARFIINQSPERRREMQENLRLTLAGEVTRQRRPRRRHRGPNKPIVRWLSGEDVTLLGAGMTADEVGISKRALARYHEHGVIPDNFWEDEIGRRWYPKEYVEFLRPLLAEQRIRREPLWRLQARVEREWQRARNNIPLVGQEAEHGEVEGDAGG